jgi:poly(ADP-ribose) glycohydrolase ARH3
LQVQGAVTPIRDALPRGEAATRFAGCFLGLALGDAFGAPHEGGPIEGMLWRLIGKTKQGELRYTDDTQMSLDLADSLLARGELDQDDLASRFAAGYRWSRGYGPGAAKVLKRIRAGTQWESASRSVYPAGSFGNGAAMRAPIVGLAFSSDRSRRLAAARDSAKITHAHPLGIEGAAIIAEATSAALGMRAWSEIIDSVELVATDERFRRKLSLCRSWLGAPAPPTASSVRDRLGTGIVATESCVTAIYVAMRFLEQPFEALLDFVAACGGDVDTIGAMAGAIWGAHNGAAVLPADLLPRLEGRARITAVAEALFTRFVEQR